MTTTRRDKLKQLLEEAFEASAVLDDAVCKLVAETGTTNPLKVGLDIRDWLTEAAEETDDAIEEFADFFFPDGTNLNEELPE